MTKAKTLVVGWDGATFDIIKPLVDMGRLPNVASLMKNGGWGRLESTVPPLTPVAWTTMTTGVNPGKHGVFDCMVYRPEMKKVGFVNAAMRQAKPVWSILSDRGRPSGVINVPMTYPPDEVNGFVISGMFTPDGVDDFIHPNALKKELEEKAGRYMIECRQAENPSVYLKMILEMVKQREKAALYLIEKKQWDLFFIVFMASDRVQHFYWKYLSPSHPEHSKYGDAIAAVYQSLDETLGRLIKKVDPDVNVMMVSDHGSGPLDSAFFLNNWLIKTGYLYLKKDLGSALKLRKPSLLRKGIVKSMKMVLPKAVIEKIKPRGVDRQEELNIFSNMIDWERTTVFSEGVAGGLYINHDLVSSEKAQELTARIKKELVSLKDPSGRDVVKEVFHRDEIYHGDHVGNAPDLTVICAAGYQIIAPNEFLFFKREYEDVIFLSHRWSGRHEKDGIFILSGPAAKKGVEILDAGIADVAPTVLYLMDEPVPEYMDGKVLGSAISDENLSQHPVAFAGDIIGQAARGKTLTEEEENEIAERLKGLGYIE